MEATHILLVEDNEINQGLMKEILSRDGYRLSFASHGGEALDLMANQDFAVVLMDLRMPVMDGYETIRHIRSIPRFNKLPVVALSAVMLRDEIDKALGLGFDYHLEKPIDFGELQWVLRQINHTYPSATLRQRATNTPMNTGLAMDFPSALKNHDHDRQLLERLLSEFINYYSLAAGDMESLISQNESELAERLAHNIAGVAGSFGAHSLLASAKELETCIREKTENLQVPLTEFGKQLQRFLEEVESYLASVDKPEP